MDNKFKLDISTKYNNYIRIEPNYNDYINRHDDVIAIELVRLSGHCDTSLTLVQAKEISNYLNEVIKYIESKPKVGDQVEIINGMFADFKGVITDIDEHDKDKPVVVQISKTSYNDEFLVFVSYDEIVKEDNSIFE